MQTGCKICYQNIVLVGQPTRQQDNTRHSMNQLEKKAPIQSVSINSIRIYIRYKRSKFKVFPPLNTTEGSKYQKKYSSKHTCQWTIESRNLVNKFTVETPPVDYQVVSNLWSTTVKHQQWGGELYIHTTDETQWYEILKHLVRCTHDHSSIQPQSILVVGIGPRFIISHLFLSFHRFLWKEWQ